MSYLFVRPPVNTSHFASGDQPCRCDGVLDVICLGVPPATGSVKMRDCPPWLALWSLMPSIFPSKDKTWSLLLRLFGSVLSSEGFLVAIKLGAQEIDMVENVGALKSDRDEVVEQDIRGVVEACHRSGAICKVILETTHC